MFLLSGLFNFSLGVVGESYNCQANYNVNTVKHIIEHWTENYRSLEIITKTGTIYCLTGPDIYGQ